jgi:hypothetical protein
MKNLILILLILPCLLLGQVNQTIDTLDGNQIDSNRRLFYKIGSDEPFTGVVIYKFSDGSLRSICNITNGECTQITRWDSIDNNKIEETKILQGSMWVSIRQTVYNSAGQKIQYSDYENNITTYWYENGNIKEEIGKVNNEPYHRFWDQNGDEIQPISSKPKDDAPLYETIQGRINNYSVIGYFLLLVITIGILIFKLQNAEKLPVLKITLIIVFSVLAMIITIGLNHKIKTMSYDRYGLWGTVFGSLSSVLYILPYLLQIIALLIVIAGIRKSSVPNSIESKPHRSI